MKTHTMMIKVPGLDTVTGIDVMKVEAEAPIVDEAEVEGEHTTAAESPATFRQIFSNRLAEHMMRKSKTKVMTLVIQKYYQASNRKLYVVLQEVLNLENTF